MTIATEDMVWANKFYEQTYGEPALCPFCHKGKPELARSGKDVFRLVCLLCGTDGPPAETSEAALELWNQCGLDPQSLQLEKELETIREQMKSLITRSAEDAEKHEALQQRLANSYANVEQISEWLNDTKPATLAFTEGPERQLAYAIEARLYKI